MNSKENLASVKGKKRNKITIICLVAGLAFMLGCNKSTTNNTSSSSGTVTSDTTYNTLYIPPLYLLKHQEDCSTNYAQYCQGGTNSKGNIS